MKNKWMIVLMFFVGVGAGALFGQMFTEKTNSDKGQTTTTKRKIKYWVAPMDPNYKRDKPGKSPMGMDLVPVYEKDDTDTDQTIIKISPGMINNLGVVTSTVKSEAISKVIETVGYVASDEDHIEHVSAFIDGWVRNLRIEAAGDPVSKGQVLFELFSPALVNAQQELILALRNNNQQLIEASRKKLMTLGLTNDQIQMLEKTRKVKQQIDIYAESSGIVSKLNIRDGMYIKPDKVLLTIEDLSSIWIKVEVYEAQSDWVKVHQMAQATFPGLPGKIWQGEVIYIYPTLDKVTHTLAVRLQFPNPNLILKPDMYATVKIFVPKSKKTLVVPISSVITTGQGSHVILSLGQGRFKPQAVTLGDESGDMVEILSGLSQGDKVVTSGQFLIDSESNLTASMTRLSPDKHQSSNNHQHAKSDLNKHRMSKTTGNILGIDKARNKITISHLPIQEYSMPEMVMEIPVVPSIDLSPFQVGQTVTFKLKETQPNHFIVIELKPTKNDTGKHNS